ncbi:type IX secretion system sortase PorU [Algoriphagus namhaensis]
MSQESYRKISVTEEGIYYIPNSALQELSDDLEQIALFGYPGALAQKLTPDDLELRQIPVYAGSDGIYFYVTAAHRWEWKDESWHWSIHPSTDTLHYYIGTSENAKRVASQTVPPAVAGVKNFYRLEPYHEQKTNILNSGRVWYSDPIAANQTKNISFQENSSSQEDWLLLGSVMSQSLSASSFTLMADEAPVSELSFNAIPNTTYGIKGRSQTVKSKFRPNRTELQQVKLSYQASDPNAAGYIEWLALGVPAPQNSLSPGIWYGENTSIFNAELDPSLEIWRLDNFYDPVRMDASSRFFEGQKIAVFDKENVPRLSLGPEVTLDLRENAGTASLLIISPKSLLSEAQRLAAHKRLSGIETELVTLEEAFDSYSYGNRDVVGLRNLIASRYHPQKRLRNVLLFGKGTFDSKQILGGRPSLLPIYTSRESLNPLTTFSSDDFFGLLEFGQGEWEESREGDELMQIGVGRIPLLNLSEAKAFVDKLIAYESAPAPGDWKRAVAFFADDADNNIHMRDAEAHSEYLYQNHRSYFQEKLYLDRFPQSNQGSGQKSPEAQESLEDLLDRGVLLLNYIGHGNATTLTAEEVFQTEDIRRWSTQEKLALWVTATCEFGRHDSPFVRSAAEELLIAPEKGAIGLLSTGRPVFSSVNFRLNEAFIEQVFKSESGESQDLGSIFKNTKNNSLNGALNRNFSLLGDPSMKLADPELEIQITGLQDAEMGAPLDTLAAFQKVRLEAQVVDPLTQAIQSSFHGEFILDLRDKPKLLETLGDESNPFQFQDERALLFRGKGEIRGGRLQASFSIPSNIDYSFGDGALRLFSVSKDNRSEALGGLALLIGGSLDKPLDMQGPLILPDFGEFRPNEQSIRSTQISFRITLEDSSGINVSSQIPGQEIQLQVNNNPPQLVSNLFLAEDGGYQKGSLMATVKGLQEGKNMLTIRAWDNLGNGSTYEQVLEVSGTDHIEILSHRVFPNPASTESNFIIRHNRPDENLELTLTVYDLSGSILFSESQRLVGVNEIIEGPKWIFLQSRTKYPAKGTYIYKLSLRSERDNSQASESGKIIIK